MDKETSPDFTSVLLAHQLQSPYLDLAVDGVSIRGRSVNIVPVRLLEVALLTEDSTPQACRVDANAGQLFEKAARQLAEQGIEFITVLRPYWNLPALWWTRP